MRSIHRATVLDNEEPEDVVFKFILVGDTGVGKSSILLKYTEDKFDQDHNVTVGVDFRSKNIKIEDKALVKLQVWDTAGQETFGSIVRSFYRDAAAIFLVYDVKAKDTFEGIKTWLEEVQSNSDTEPIYILIGNQADSQDRQVTYDEGVEFMKQNDLSFFFETSAAQGTNIDMAFFEAAQLCYLKYNRSKMNQSDARSSMNLKDHNRPGQRLTVDKATKEKKEKTSNCCPS